MMYDLPTTANVCGTEYEIRSDFRDILNIFGVLGDVDLTNDEKAIGVLGIFYPDYFEMPVEHMEEALKECFSFINCGSTESGKKTPKLMDWEQDFQYLIAPINRVAGQEVRAMQYMHWWTFISMYYEIGDCYFAQIVRIRSLKAQGKLKDKLDKEFYRKNKDAVDLKTHYTSTEESIISAWT